MDYGFNVDAKFIGNRGQLIEWVRAKQPPTMLVMDDNGTWDLCRDIKDASSKTLVVHRRYSADENKPSVSPEQYVSALVNAPRGIIHNVFNEPGLSGTDLHFTVNYITEVMNFAAARGVHLCVGNFSTGSWQKQDIDAGVFDAMLRKIAAHPTLFYMGVHEYNTGILPFHFNNGRIPLDLVSPHSAQPDRWVTKEQFTKDWQTNFHTGRYLWFVERCKVLNIAPPKFILTEFGWDRNGDILTHVDIDGYAERTVTGLNTLGRYWSKLYPQWTFIDAVMRQLAHMGHVYTEHVVGACLYCWSINGEWSGYHYAIHPQLLQRLIAYNEVVTPPVVEAPPPPPVTPPVVKKEHVPFPTTGFAPRLIYATKDIANLRHEPYAPPDGIQIGQLTHKPQIAQIARASAFGEWIPVRLSSGLNGWISDSVFDDDPIPMLETAPPDNTEVRNIVISLEAKLADMTEQIRALKEKLSA